MVGEVGTSQRSLTWLRPFRAFMHEKKTRKEICVCIMQKSPLVPKCNCSFMKLYRVQVFLQGLYQGQRNHVTCCYGIPHILEGIWAWRQYGPQDRREHQLSPAALAPAQPLAVFSLRRPSATRTQIGDQFASREGPPCPWFVFPSAPAELPGGALGSPREGRTAACEWLTSTDQCRHLWDAHLWSCFID